MSFTTFSTIASGGIGISNVAKKNIVPGIPSYSLKHTNIDYQTAFVFGTNIWNSILSTQRYTNSRTIGSAALLTGTQAWLNGTYTWSSNATTTASNLGYLTEGDPSISWNYVYPSSNPIYIAINFPSNIRVALRGIIIKSVGIGADKTITVDGSNDNGTTYVNNIASFVTTTALTVGENLTCTTTTPYNIIRFNIPYLNPGGNGTVYLHTLNPTMDVYSNI